MKIGLAFVAALLLPISSGAIDRAASGLWFNPSQSGHGFELTVISPNTATLTWYTYSPFGGPIWLAGLLTESSPGQLTGALTYYDGMRFGSFNPSDQRSYPWGSITFALQPNSCTRATVTYNGTLTYQTGEGFGAGSIPVEQLAGVDGLSCNSSTPAPQSSLAGVYVGNMDSTLSGGSQFFYLGVTAAGEFTAVVPDVAAFTGTFSGLSTISGNITATPVAGTSFPQGVVFSANGTARAADYIRAAYSGSGDSGTIDATWLGASTRSHTLASIAGNYVDATGATGFSGTLATDGRFSGRDRFGCTFSGRLPSVIETPFRLSAEVTGCPVAGTYSGMAMVVDWAAAGDSRALVLGLKGPASAIATVIRR